MTSSLPPRFIAGVLEGFQSLIVHPAFCSSAWRRIVTASVQQQASTRERIVSLLSDGRPRTTAEMHGALETSKWNRVAKTVAKMVADGELHVAAGCAHRPANGHTARRYLLAEGVTA